MVVLCEKESVIHVASMKFVVYYCFVVNLIVTRRSGSMCTLSVPPLELEGMLLYYVLVGNNNLLTMNTAPLAVPSSTIAGPS